VFNFFRKKPEEIQILEIIIGKKLKKLKKISYNSVGYCQNEQGQITKLYLYQCNLRDLPPQISKLQNLTELNLNHNQLSTLPLEIVKLQNLTRLDLNDNQLSTLPPEIGKLQNLTELNLNYNQLSTLPPEIGKLQNLTELDLSSNQLSTLPPEIGKLENLTWLYLSSNQLSTLPSEIGKLQNLTQLDLSTNQLSTLPPEIGKLENLTRLNLNDNQLSTLPPEIGKLENLTWLYLSSNQLSTLPPEIGKLENLIRLNLNDNQLSTLPPEIGKLENLTDLHLDNNPLSTLPPEIGKLEKLTRLSLFDNKFTHFPKVLLALDLAIQWNSKFYQKGIHIEDNPFETPPVEIVKQGRQAIVDYYAALAEEERLVVPVQAVVDSSLDNANATKKSPREPQVLTHPQALNESKLILIGEGAAGKTSLMKRLLGQDFNPQESQTHGINIQTFTLEDKQQNPIKLHCWDFGGQQIMHATHQFFLSKRCLYLLVMDSRREAQVDYWLKHIQTFGKQAPVIIVINKIDENPHFHLPQQRQLKQRYPNLKQITRLSCATKEGIATLKAGIQATFPDIELLNTRFPAKWFAVKSALAEQAKKTHFSSYEQYVALCENKGIYKESEQKTLIHFLHDLGIINHFPDPWLRETNVINPQWITEAVYGIITAPMLANQGKLHRNDLKTLLAPEHYPERKHDYILALMKKFELCYALNDSEYLLPDLFPLEEPEFEFNDADALHFIVEYDFLPKSIFTRFIIKLHQHIVKNTYWRSGVLLQDSTSDTLALVETIDNGLEFKLIGTQKREYLLILRFVLIEIHRSFDHLEVTEKIGLANNCRVNYQYLVEIAKDGQQIYRPPEDSSQRYNISQLVGQVVSTRSDAEIIQKLHDIQETLDNPNIVTFEPKIFGLKVDMNALARKVLK